jgi:phosphatidylinositol-3-phosphatase
MPNLCDDGHDATCAGTNTDGGHDWRARRRECLAVGLDATNPRLAGLQGMLVVITTDEGAITDSRAVDNEEPGPGNPNPGYSPLLNVPVAAFGGKTYYQVLGVTGLTPGLAPPAGTLPGGGDVGALLLNARYIKPGTVNPTPANHYSALRSYETSSAS